MVHASDLTNEDRPFCAREHVLKLRTGYQNPSRKLGIGLRTTFDEGRDKQSRINNDYLRGRMVGDWRCRICGQTVKWSKAPNMKGTCAEGSDCTQFEYQEVVFRHEKFTFKGSVDGFVDADKGLLIPLEIKILNTEEFRKLEAPQAEHRIRSRVYLRLIAESIFQHKAEIDTGKMHVLYIARGYGVKQSDNVISPFKEFIVERDDESVQPYFDKLEQLQKSRESEYANLPKGVCETLFHKRAQACPLSKECFSGKFLEAE